jgi:hypothetical protein
MDVAEFKIVFSLMNRNTSLGLYEVVLMDSEKSGYTHYVHAQTPDFEMKDSVAHFAYETRDVTDCVVFYRTASARGGLNTGKWLVNEGQRGRRFAIATREPWVRMLVIFKVNSPKSAVGPLSMLAEQ